MKLVFTRCLATVAAISLLALTACDATGSGPSRMTSDRLQQDVSKAIDEYIIQGKSVDEVKKLHQLEYQVLSLPMDSSAHALEGALDEMGKNRWDCFHVEKLITRTDRGTDAKFVIFCKRNPETPLRFIPRTLLGR